MTYQELREKVQYKFRKKSKIKPEHIAEYLNDTTREMLIRLLAKRLALDILERKLSIRSGDESR